MKEPKHKHRREHPERAAVISKGFTPAALGPGGPGSRGPARDPPASGGGGGGPSGGAGRGWNFALFEADGNETPRKHGMHPNRGNGFFAVITAGRAGRGAEIR